MLDELNKSKTGDILEKSKEVLKWLKIELWGLLNSESFYYFWERRIVLRNHNCHNGVLSI